MAGAGGAQVSEADYADDYDGQTRLQVSTLVSTNVVLGRLDSVQTEMTAQFQQMLTMLQQGPVRQRSRTLSMHSQVEHVDFNSETTRVCCHPCLQVHTNGHHSQVVANPTTSIVTFSILSPDASLSYDRIKLRLEEYRTLLASDSDTIKLSTENGKTIICRKRANEMGEYLDQAEILLRDVLQSRDISTLVVLHHLRDLAKVLDNLKLYDECRLTGNCALDLAEALGRRSLEFKQEQAETLALIARLSVYQSRALTLAIQAVSICEEVVANNASHSNKFRLLIVLTRAGGAGDWVSDHLFAQWMGRAVQLMMKQLPPTMVDPSLRGMIYCNYGRGLSGLRQYANALEAFHESISICRTLVNTNPATYIILARALTGMGIVLHNLGKYDDAIVAYKEAREICMTFSVQDPLQYNEMMAITLHSYGVALWELNQVSEAATLEKQAISLYRNVAETGKECARSLCSALHSHGYTCYLLGQHAEAVLLYQESILLRRPFAAADHEEEQYLIVALHHIANCLHALDRRADANAAANEALERNHGRVYGGCRYAPDFRACFVCRRGMTHDLISNVSPLPSLRAVSSPHRAEHPAAEAPLTEETANTSVHKETANTSVHKERGKILGLFRWNRAR